MKKLKILFLSIITVLSIISCSTVPLTGRKQLNLIPANEMLSLSYQQYDQFLTENKVSNDKKNTALVKKVGTNIQHAVEKYLAENNLSSRLDGYKWEFNLVQEDQVNAWCMPGGKVVVYTGILPITKNEIGLAVVLGHEIAHAIAEHGNERMSQGLVQQLGGAALSVALRDKPQLTQDLFLTAYGVGSTIGILSYSRTQESEADHLGLIFMAMADYNPNAAVDFWQRMAEMNKGSKPPEFLSTHPSDQTRINDIKNWLPEALKYYKQ
jgi:predicted Zn-dependent protease